MSILHLSCEIASQNVIELDMSHNNAQNMLLNNYCRETYNVVRAYYGLR